MTPDGRSFGQWAARKAIFRIDLVLQTTFDFVGAGFGLLPQHLPALERKSVRPLDVESFARHVHGRQRLADFPAMLRLRLSKPHAFQKRNQRCRTAGQLASSAPSFRGRGSGQDRPLSARCCISPKKKGRSDFSTRFS